MLIDDGALDRHNPNGDDEDKAVPKENHEQNQSSNSGPFKPSCPVCGGPLIEIRAKLQCARCHTICETCCEGGQG